MFSRCIFFSECFGVTDCGLTLFSSQALFVLSFSSINELSQPFHKADGMRIK